MSSSKQSVKRVAPWPCYRGNQITEGCTIIHPADKSRGVVAYLSEFELPEDQWRVDYGDDDVQGSFLSRLCLQIGDKGMAYVYLGDEAIKQFSDD